MDTGTTERFRSHGVFQRQEGDLVVFGFLYFCHFYNDMVDQNTYTMKETFLPLFL